MFDNLKKILPDNLKLSIVIPVYNEENTVEEIINIIKQIPVNKEIVIINDGSSDNTATKLRQYQLDPEIKIFHHEKNQGKGAALKTGFTKTTGDIVIIQDADLEYDPNDYAHLINPIILNNADVVYGSRFRGEKIRVLYFWHYVGNKLLTLFSNALTNLNLSDMETCYKVFKGDLIRKMAPSLQQKRFGIEPELTSRLAKIPNVKFYEVPINYSGRTYDEGKKITWKDGLKAIWCIVKYH